MKKLLAMVLALVMTLSLAVSANAALVKGYPDGNFKPSGNVTGYEVLAMILRAVGYDKNGEFTGADWALHVAEIAERQGILDNVKGVDLNAPATRELVSELLFRSIQVPMVTYTAAFGYAAVVSHRAEVFAERGTASPRAAVSAFSPVAVASAFSLSAASVLPKASLKSSILMKSCFSHCGRE